MTYYHKLNTSQKEDVLVYKDTEHPDWSHKIGLTDDEDYAVLALTRGTGHLNNLMIAKTDTSKKGI